MGFLTGKNTYFNLDTVGNTPTDLSAYCDSCDFPETVDTHESTTYSSTRVSKTYIVGLRDNTFSVGGPWDAVIEAHMVGILAAHPASLSFIVGPEGSAQGKRRRTGECILTQYSGSFPVGDKETWTANFQVTGDVTGDTFP